MVTIRKQLLTFQKKVRELSLREFIKLKAHLAVECLDCRVMGTRTCEGEDDPKITPVRYAAGIIQDRVREIKKTRRRDPLYDFNFEVTVFPLTTKKALGMYFCDRREFTALIKSQPWFIDYHYQNSTDRPDEISAKEWRKRSADWDRTLGSMGIPAQCGFTLDLGVPYLPYEIVRPPDLMPYVPDFRTRVRMQAEHLFPGKTFKTKLSKADQKSVYKRIEEVRKFGKSPAGQRVKKNAANKVRKKLKRRISQSDLYGDWINKCKRRKA